MTRNQRRKASAAKQAAKDANVIEAFKAQQRDAIIRRNLASKPERNYYPKSCLDGIQGQSHRAYVCSAIKRLDMGDNDRATAALKARLAKAAKK